MHDSCFNEAMRALVPVIVAAVLFAQIASADEPLATSKSPLSSNMKGRARTPEDTSAPTRLATAPARSGERSKTRKPRKRREIKGPVANFPSFRVLPDGSSRVQVQITKKVTVTENKAEGRFVYRMKGTSVTVRTNLLPLVTSYFKTPVGRVQLVEPNEEDVDLVIELRQPSTATYRLVETEGGVLLQVSFPPPTGQTAPKSPRK